MPMTDSGTRICIVGSGSWGTTLALIADTAGHHVALVTRDEATTTAIRLTRRHPRVLPGIELPAGIDVTADLPAACNDASAIIVAVPSQAMRATARRLAPLTGHAFVISAAKGLELGSLQRMTQILRTELPPAAHDRICALSGPNLAGEIAAGKPATTVIASTNLEAAERVRDLLITPRFRAYTNADVIGVEMAGALKNVIAIGAGIGDGLGLGDNAKAAFMTRGIAEIARMGIAAGAEPLTFAGLAGLGDLVATCSSPLSRNRHVGTELARGRSLSEIQATMTEVAEGIFTVQAARELGERLGVDLPITNQLAAVLFDNKSPLAAIEELMNRDAKHEFADLGSGPTPDQRERPPAHA
jgi:glycerol-3-phosphate dehydrogenase (NAD(P)+)